MSIAKHLRAEIVYRRDYAPDLWSIRLRPEQPMAFQPGQYATLGVDEQGRLTERAYSICSSPEEDELEFFFELVPHGVVTPQLYMLGRGAEVFIRPSCKGLFTFDEKSGRRNHIMVATVTGVAPFVSMIRSFRRNKRLEGHRLYVLVGASRSWEFGYAEELQHAQRSCDWLRFIPTVSRCWEDPNWQGERGRVDDILRKYADQFGLSPEDTTAYLCGHPTMIENAEGILGRRGFQKGSIKKEIYFVIPKKRQEPEAETRAA